MTRYSSPTHSPRCGWLFPLAMLLTASTAVAQSASAVQGTAAELAPGIPNKPDLVTVIPFYSKPNETPLEQTKVVVPAEIDGHRGIFILDLGATPTVLNRTFLQPSPSGGVDTITDANRIADNVPRTNYIQGSLAPFDKVHVHVRIGTLDDPYDDPDLTRAIEGTKPPGYNAILGHLWGNFGWVFSPRMGNIGPAVLAPFETIIDYTKRRVVLIRLDSAGHRMVDVPAYTPRWSAPLVPIQELPGIHALGVAVGPGNTLDTLNNESGIMLKPGGAVDTLYADHTHPKLMDTGAASSGNNILGYDFLSGLGVFGLNQRTHQFFLYH